MKRYEYRLLMTGGCGIETDGSKVLTVTRRRQQQFSLNILLSVTQLGLSLQRTGCGLS